MEHFRQIAVPVVLALAAVVEEDMVPVLAILDAKGGGIIPLEELLQVCERVLLSFFLVKKCRERKFYGHPSSLRLLVVIIKIDFS